MSFFTLADNTRGIRGHSRKLINFGAHGTAVSIFFSNRVINRWNQLDQWVVDASSINAFTLPRWGFWLVRPHKVSVILWLIPASFCTQRTKVDRESLSVVNWLRLLSIEHSNSGKKSFDSIRFSLPNQFFSDSIRQSDKFAACTLIFKCKLGVIL